MVRNQAEEEGFVSKQRREGSQPSKGGRVRNQAMEKGFVSKQNEKGFPFKQMRKGS